MSDQEEPGCGWIGFGFLLGLGFLSWIIGIGLQTGAEAGGSIVWFLYDLPAGLLAEIWPGDYDANKDVFDYAVWKFGGWLRTGGFWSMAGSIPLGLLLGLIVMIVSIFRR